MAGSDTSQLAHLRQVEKSKGIQLVEDDELEPPAHLRHVWEWFIELHGRRSSAGYGPNPISYQDLQAWSLLTGSRPRTVEVAMIVAVDDVYMAQVLKQLEKQNSKSQGTVGRQPVINKRRPSD